MNKDRRSDTSKTVQAEPAAARGSVVLQLKGMLVGKDFATQERMLTPIQMRPHKTPPGASAPKSPPGDSAPRTDSGGREASPSPTDGISTPDQTPAATQGEPDHSVAAPQNAGDDDAPASPFVQSIDRALAVDRSLLAQWNAFLEADTVAERDLYAGLRGARATANESLIEALQSAHAEQMRKCIADQAMIDAVEDVIAAFETLKSWVENNETGLDGAVRDPRQLHEDLLRSYRTRIAEMRAQRDQLDSQELVQSALRDGMIDDEEQAAINTLHEQRERLTDDIENARALIRSLERVLDNADWDDDAS